MEWTLEGWATTDLVAGLRGSATPTASAMCTHALAGRVGRLTPMTITWPMAVLVGRCAKVAVPSALDRTPLPGSTCRAARRRRQSCPTPSTSSRRPRPWSTPTLTPPFSFELGPDQGRRTIDELQSGPVNKPTVDIDDTTVPGGPSGQVSVRILRPQGARRPLAVILYLHGAGWVFGNHHTHDRLIRELAVGAQAAVVFPNYSRSPEAKYPTAIQECDAVASWVAAHGQERGLDPSRIAIAGDSVGGNMTAAVTLLANQRGGPAFRQQVLFYPVTDATFDTGSTVSSPPATTYAATPCNGPGTSTPPTPPSGPNPPPPRWGQPQPARRPAARPGHHRRS